jgi:hypothetical protein
MTPPLQQQAQAYSFCIKHVISILQTYTPGLRHAGNGYNWSENFMGRRIDGDLVAVTYTQDEMPIMMRETFM